MALDPYQQAAVDCNDQHIQIVGHPGTGKTMVMGNRIARLLREGTPPESIAALTFSNSARISLRNRLMSLLGDMDTVNALEINTFHSFCAHLVQRYPESVGVTGDWHMIDHLDMYNVLGEPSLGLPLKNRSYFPNGYTAADRERFRQRLAKDRSYDFETAMELGCEIAGTQDLGFEHLLIDEFQDGQNMQWQLVRAMAHSSPELNICAVGDANQEIFAFREDHLPDAFGAMRDSFPNCTILDLRYNYRSSPEIIETFESIIPQDSLHRPELIATHPSNVEPEIRMYGSEAEEVSGIADLVRELMHTNKPGDIAILVRFNNQLHEITRELESQGIETSSAVNMRSMAAKALPNLFISLLKWATDPRDLYLAQVLFNRYQRIIPEADYAQLSQESYPSEGMIEALTKLDAKYLDHPFIASYLPHLRELLLSAQTPGELIGHAVAAAEAWRQLASRRKSVFKPTVGWTEFKNGLSAIEETADRSIGSGAVSERGGVLKAVLRQLYSADDLGWDHRVNVLTVHSAKSREWRSVIVSGREPKWAGLLNIKDEEERKLLYVAASRAKEQLYFTGPSSVHGSNFLKFLHPRATELVPPQRAVSQYPKQYMKILAQRAISRAPFRIH